MRNYLIVLILIAVTVLPVPSRADEEGFLGLILTTAPKGGVAVGGLASGASAQKAGVKEGDIVLRYRGQAVRSNTQLIDAVKKTAPGQTAELVVRRGAKEIPFQILIVSRKEFLGEQIEALKGKKAPQLTGRNVLTGNELSVSQFKGRPLIIVLWATWCPACVTGVPKLNALAEAQGERLGIMAVSFEELKVLKAFAAKKKIKYNVVSADTKNMSLSYMNNASIPKYLLVDAKGTLVDIFMRVEDAALALDKL